MEEKETRLQKILQQESEKIGRAILKEIENGEKVERTFTGSGIVIGGIHICEPIKHIKGSNPCVVLKLKQPEIAQLFEPSKEYLQTRSDELRKELEEIENELKTLQK